MAGAGHESDSIGIGSEEFGGFASCGSNFTTPFFFVQATALVHVIHEFSYRRPRSVREGTHRRMSKISVVLSDGKLLPNLMVLDHSEHSFVLEGTAATK
jgi:hypothetical protein